MNVIGLDTSMPSTAVGLLVGGDQLFEAYDERVGGERPGHQQRLLELAHEVLGRAHVRWTEVDRVAVGLGPGTYTGMRVGVATARALAQSLSAEIVGVSSSMALAHAALQSGVSGDRDHVLTVVDARRREVFVAAYARAAAAAPPALLAGPQPLAPAAVGAWLANVEPQLVSPRAAADRRPSSHGAGSWLAVGDATGELADELSALGVVVPPTDSRLHRVGARALCELGSAIAPDDIADVLPQYCRRPDAEIALARRDADADGVADAVVAGTPTARVGGTA
jgi:tRNA threonylcarbamoyladenosine biosynthesis protein TsaB